MGYHIMKALLPPVVLAFAESVRLEWDVTRTVLAVTSLLNENEERNRIYIDCGFNNCVALKKVINSLPNDFKFYGFEAQDELHPHAIKLCRDHPDREIHLTFSAVSDSDTYVACYPSKTLPGSPFHQEGTTILPGKINVKYDHQSIVPCVNFPEWIKNIKKQETVDGNAPFVVLKMDIEGAEYHVLEGMLRNGTIADINLLIVEYHAHKFKGSQLQVAHGQIIESLCELPILRRLEWH